VGVRDLLARWRRREPGPGSAQVVVGDPFYDDWPVVRDFGDIASARSWLQHLREAGFEAELTSDWPLDRFGHGDIALRVAPGQWSEATEVLDDLD
jgi:hypothetical protein